MRHAFNKIQAPTAPVFIDAAPIVTSNAGAEPPDVLSQSQNERAMTVPAQQSVGRSKEEAEEYARNMVAPRKKGEPQGPTTMFS